jgi:hypothetical protein
MIKSYDVLWPADFPYRLMSFKFYFENVNTHMLNLYHAAGMNFIYEQIKICYLFPQNEFYQLLKLQNTQEPHSEKYNSILIKGVFADAPKTEADLEIENEQLLDVLHSGSHFNKHHLNLHRLPEAGNDMVFTDESRPSCFHHFVCSEFLSGIADRHPLIRLLYSGSCGDFFEIINPWLSDKDKRVALS